MRTTWLVLVVLVAGCGDEFSVPPRDDGGGGGCSSLSLTACANSTQCKVQPGCCGGPSTCVDKDRPAVACICLQPCSDLGEADCRARTDCKADTCIQCSCTPTYVGCRAKTAAALPCPAVECAQPSCCSTSADCNSSAGSYCAEPGARICGGACMLPEPCMTDLDCKTAGMPNAICDPVPCSCGSGNGCQPGCAVNDDCAEGQTCDATHRCVAKVCVGGAGCPANFDCVPVGPTELCRRRTCTSAAVCDGSGSCVNGSCYKSLGMCEFPRP